MALSESELYTIVNAARLIPMDLTHIPMPPSINKVLGNNLSGKGRGRYYKPEKKEWDRHFHIWCLANVHKLKEARNQILALEPGIYLGLHKTFYFNRSSLFTQKGSLRRMDTDNREKMLQDALMTALGCDDSFVKGGSSWTKINPWPEKGEFVNIRLDFTVLISED